MKNVLVVSACPVRGNSVGLTGRFMSILNGLSKNDFQFSLFDTSSEIHDGSKFLCHKYYTLPLNSFCRFLMNLPRVGVYVRYYLTSQRFKRILNETHFDTVILYQVNPYADSLTDIAHKKGAKMIFVPWGSEILRVSGATKKKLLNAFSNVDIVVGIENANNYLASQYVYHVPDKKMRKMKYELKGVWRIMQVRNKLSRKEMSEWLRIPYSDYNIVCGYNGYLGQNHKLMIDSIAQNRDVLPKNYQLVFPITYGASSEYIESLRSICESLQLKAVFLTEFLTDDQVAYLHLLTDLHIEIQPTDNGNTFLVESLFSENQIITGRWLNYKQFELYGIPYYLIETLEELPDKLRNVLCGNEPKAIVPQQLIDVLTPETEDDNILFWDRLLKEL